MTPSLRYLAASFGVGWLAIVVSKIGPESAAWPLAALCAVLLAGFAVKVTRGK